MGAGGPTFGKNSQKIPYFFSERLPKGFVSRNLQLWENKYRRFKMDSYKSSPLNKSLKQHGARTVFLYKKIWSFRHTILWLFDILYVSVMMYLIACWWHPQQKDPLIYYSCKSNNGWEGNIGRRFPNIWLFRIHYRVNAYLSLYLSKSFKGKQIHLNIYKKVLHGGQYM